MTEKADPDIVARHIREGQLARAIAYLEDGLARAPGERFRSLLGRGFANPPSEVAEALAAFRASCEQTFAVKSIYLEMNGFDINPDRWYFDFFGFAGYSDDEEDLDWLAEWDSDRWPAMTLVGLEPVQAEFAWYTGQGGHDDPAARVAASYAKPLVMCRFAELIGRAVALAGLADNAGLATAHDFDTIPRFLPPSWKDA
jgi:hypothetical protein